ncbi:MULTISPECIES: PRC and DUF2382 domain-containing protein [unclassified Nocardiopsis]|uniref:PRC and DUF2382 domain-containing protein n=1 Tax=Nocardiopsis TaxID=2013 RepID=UPI00387B0CF3
MTGHRAERFVGHHMLDEEGNNIGKVARVYLDDRTGDATWASVHTGLFGMRETLVPLQGAQPVQEDIQVPYDKSTVKDAPNIDAKDHISPSEEQEVREYYEMHAPTAAGRTPGTVDPEAAGRPATETEGWAEPAGVPPRPQERAGTGAPTAGPGADEEVVIRSEEQIDVGVERREAGQARMRRHVDTERFDETVPVGHEELEVERRPITDPSQMKDPNSMEEGEETFTLYEERPVVTKREVPVEEIHVRKREVTHEEHVEGERRTERIEFEGDDGTPEQR